MKRLVSFNGHNIKLFRCTFKLETNISLNKLIVNCIQSLKLCFCGILYLFFTISLNIFTYYFIKLGNKTSPNSTQ